MTTLKTLGVPTILKSEIALTALVTEEWQTVTVCFQIGNSDDKLSQVEWHEFVRDVNSIVSSYATAVHFSGMSAGDAPWQNAAWICECNKMNALAIRNALSRIRATYQQDSVAWMEGETEFI